ncbi:N-terminal EF-hand calcium-binding protein 3 isoform X2 [Microtus ochrogaster]|uniref:N-terminal EF-hand calcium-binding protein 3 isoform X2 n=1 Tax=Microtus ochrogaster TaxID=79684 RepID=A0ABM1ULV4_MICOH|nr:N-terminal EF-hand calcium-binding protein 3 isoform X2 [Microtus ochrogaster]
MALLHSFLLTDGLSRDRSGRRPGCYVLFIERSPSAGEPCQALRAAGEGSGAACAAAPRGGRLRCRPRGGSAAARIAAASPAGSWPRPLARQPRDALPPAAVLPAAATAPGSFSSPRSERLRACLRRRPRHAAWAPPLRSISGRRAHPQPAARAAHTGTLLPRPAAAACPAGKAEYEQASKVDQFVTRFLLRETVSQLQALQSSLEGASDTLEAQARGQRLNEEHIQVQSRSRSSRRAGRRALKSISWSPAWSPGSSDTGWTSEAELQWRLQVNRLQELIDQLECKAPRLEPLQEDLAKGPDSHILVAQRQVQVAEDALQDFHHALCCYMNFTGAQSHCLQHQQSPCSKAFQRTLIDHLQAPDTLTTVFFPASWWIMNNN